MKELYYCFKRMELFKIIEIIQNKWEKISFKWLFLGILLVIIFDYVIKINTTKQQDMAKQQKLYDKLIKNYKSLYESYEEILKTNQRFLKYHKDAQLLCNQFKEIIEELKLKNEKFYSDLNMMLSNSIKRRPNEKLYLKTKITDINNLQIANDNIVDNNINNYVMINDKWFANSLIQTKLAHLYDKNKLDRDKINYKKGVERINVFYTDFCNTFFDFFVALNNLDIPFLTKHGIVLSEENVDLKLKSVDHTKILVNDKTNVDQFLGKMNMSYSNYETMMDVMMIEVNFCKGLANLSELFGFFDDKYNDSALINKETFPLCSNKTSSINDNINNNVINSSDSVIDSNIENKEDMIKSTITLNNNKNDKMAINKQNNNNDDDTIMNNVDKFINKYFILSIDGNRFTKKELESMNKMDIFKLYFAHLYKLGNEAGPIIINTKNFNGLLTTVKDLTYNCLDKKEINDKKMDK